MRSHLEAIIALQNRTPLHPKGHVIWTEYVGQMKAHANAALALLNESAETEARVTTPSGFKVYKPARLVSDWTPSSSEPPAHGWPADA